jgi:hypothetical protein
MRFPQSIDVDGSRTITTAARTKIRRARAARRARRRGPSPRCVWIGIGTPQNTHIGQQQGSSSNNDEISPDSGIGQIIASFKSAASAQPTGNSKSRRCVPSRCRARLRRTAANVYIFYFGAGRHGARCSTGSSEWVDVASSLGPSRPADVGKES